MISLLKPQYETKLRKAYGEKISEEEIENIVQKVKIELSEIGIIILDIIKSPIVGKKGGNTEYVMLLGRNNL